MWTNIIEAATANGLWAVLFVTLLVYILQDSRKREAKYQNTIEILTERLEVVGEIKEKLDNLVCARREKQDRREQNEKTDV